MIDIIKSEWFHRKEYKQVKWMRVFAIPLIAILLVTSTAMAAPSFFDINEIDVLSLPEWKLTSSNHGGKLLLSDSPETVPEDGIMYQDTVVGDGRLFFYHANGTKELKKFAVLIENPSDRPATVTVYHHGLSGPSLDYLVVGKTVQNQYMTTFEPYIVEVPSKGSSHLIYELDDMVVKPEMLVNGMYDFHADSPVTIKTMMMSVKTDARKFAVTAKVLPADQWKLRGTFDGYDRMLVPHNIYDPQQYGPVALTLADNKQDIYLKGIDATDGSPVVNYGNYGVLYRLFLPSEKDGKVSYWLNPRGGAYAGMMGIKYNHVTEHLNTPADRIIFSSKTIKEMQKLGTFPAGSSLWFTFSPPGASNLPVKIILLPER